MADAHADLNEGNDGDKDDVEDANYEDDDGKFKMMATEPSNDRR